MTAAIIGRPILLWIQKYAIYAIEMTGALIHKTVKILAHEVVHKEMNMNK